MRKAIFSSGFILLLFKSASESVTSFAASHQGYTDKKENEIFLIEKETQMGAAAKSYMIKGFLIHEEMRKYLTIYEEAVSHI
jgi:hypothetical protein